MFKHIISFFACCLVLSLGLLTNASAAKKPLQKVDYVYLGKDYVKPPPLSLVEKILTDEGVQGARLSSRDNNRSGRLLGWQFVLQEVLLPKTATTDDVVQQAKTVLAAGHKLIILDLQADDLLAVADLADAQDAVLVNIRASDNRLRQAECRRNVFHFAPSRAMRADALGQYLRWKKWRNWLLIAGKYPADQAYAAAIQRAAKRFGSTIVEQRDYQFEAGSRRVETGHQQVQTQMPLVTQNAPEHDVVIVADEMETFGSYLPYRTFTPRPVVGTQGMVATAWHRSYEQYGGMSIQNSFDEFAHRHMTERDYLAWLAIKMFAEATIRSKSSEPAKIRDYILADDFKLAGYKGRGMNFRPWNQQLRQPILLSSPRSLVSVSPQPGFLHPTHYTDTLGFDQPETHCQF